MHINLCTILTITPQLFPMFSAIHSLRRCVVSSEFLIVKKPVATNLGKLQIILGKGSCCFSNKRPPVQAVWNRNMKRWAVNAGLGEKGAGFKYLSEPHIVGINKMTIPSNLIIPNERTH